MGEAITREEYIQRYGYDPAPDAVQVSDEGEALPPARGGVKDHLIGAVAGVAGAIPDVIGLIPTVYAAGKAGYTAYNEDKNFFPEFEKNREIEGAEKNTQDHIDKVAQTWRERDPTLSDEDIQQGLQNYVKSKEFEDFKTSQLSGTHWLSTAVKSGTRSFLGDKRPSSERGWTESAAEIGGSALVGGPAGLVGKLNKVPALAGIVANRVGRGAVQTAEAITPLTIPYTPTNIAINAGAGIAMDQGVRYLQGQDTAFTPKNEESAAIGTLVAGGATMVGVAAFANAIRGRSNAALIAAQARQSPTARALERDMSLDYRVNDPVNVGESFMEGGPTQELGPTSAMANLPWYQRGYRKGMSQAVDQGFVPDSMIADIHGGATAENLAAMRMSNSGAVLNDTIPSDVSNAMQNIVRDFEAMTPEEYRASSTALWNASYSAHLQVIEDTTRANIAKLQATIHKPGASNRTINDAQKKLTKLQSDLQRFVNDDPSARPSVPHIPMASARTLANAFMQDTAPHNVQLKNSVTAFNKLMLDLSVRAQKITAKDAADLHARNPLYVHALNDPLKGLRGAERFFEDAMQSVDRKMMQASQGTASSVAHEGPLRRLDKTIPDVKVAGAPETRITQPMHPISAMAQYAEQAYRDVAHTRVKNEYVRHLAYTDARSIPSKFMTDRNIRIIKSPTGKDWWSPVQLHGHGLYEKMKESSIVDEWNGGRVRLWEFGDAEVPRALRMEPVAYTGLMKAVSVSSNIAKATTTGKFAPGFAGKGSLYDTGIAVLTRPADRAFGPLTYRMHRHLPEWIAHEIGGRIPDITAYGALPWHGVANFIEMQAYRMSGFVSKQLTSQVPGFSAFQAIVGPRTFQNMTQTALRVASWADTLPAVRLHKGGATRGAQTIDNIPTVRNAFSMIKDKIPAPLRVIWGIYTDLLDSFYMANKRQYYSQNYDLFSRKNGGVVPHHVNEVLINETRRMAGEMTYQPANKMVADLEKFFPYLTQTKLGAYQLAKSLGTPASMQYTMPRLMIAMMGVGTSFYWMTHWNEGSSDYLWNRMSEQNRWRTVTIPSPKLLLAWAMGKDPPFSPDLIYQVPVPPDIAGIIAGSAAFMQMMGMIPASATPVPISKDLPKIWLDSMTPAMPPGVQAALGAGGYKLDPQSSDTRGGNWIRSFNSNFQMGPQTEGISTLGQVSNSTALIMSGLFGALGGHIAVGTDIMLHAAKYKPELGPGNLLQRRDAADYGEGLRKGTTEVLGRLTKLPDIYPLWKNEAKYVTTTPAWQYVKEKMVDINVIKGMRDHADGKAGQIARAMQGRIGGMPKEVLTDVALIQISREIAAWERQSGPLGKLQKAYNDLGKQASSVSAQYNMPTDKKNDLHNRIVKLQQDNMMQQQAAVLLAEQYIAKKYGAALAPRLDGRAVNMNTLSVMMRESLGGG